MTEEATQYTLDSLKKYVEPLGDILRKQNLEQHLSAIEKDLVVIDSKPDQENYGVIRKHLNFLRWLIKERM